MPQAGKSLWNRDYTAKVKAKSLFLMGKYSLERQVVKQRAACQFPGCDNVLWLYKCHHGVGGDVHRTLYKALATSCESKVTS